MRPAVIMKYGGSSLGNSEMIKQVIGIIYNRYQDRPLIVPSATKGTTDEL
ncbi:MAG: hypothetical protein HZB65_02705 [Candidatus Aenigmarchaeota archaeon]|nr:hypothetical protein [Candidatus Aenigmarchaeota archaeon]